MLILAFIKSIQSSQIKIGGKKFWQNLILSTDGPFKIQKQGRDVHVITQEDYPTMDQWWKRKTERLPNGRKKDKKITLHLLHIQQNLPFVLCCESF